MKRPLVVLCAAAAALFAATAAEAGGVGWSVGVNVPPVATYVSGGPAWYPAPVRYGPPMGHVRAPIYVDPYVGAYGVAPYPVYGPVHRRPHGWVAPPHVRQGWNRHDGWRYGGGHHR